jgi:hypothetical protein
MLLCKCFSRNELGNITLVQWSVCQETADILQSFLDMKVINSLAG